MIPWIGLELALAIIGFGLSIVGIKVLIEDWRKQR